PPAQHQAGQPGRTYRWQAGPGYRLPEQPGRFRRLGGHPQAQLGYFYFEAARFEVLRAIHPPTPITTHTATPVSAAALAAVSSADSTRYSAQTSRPVPPSNIPPASTANTAMSAKLTPTLLASLPISRAWTASRSTNAMPTSARLLSTAGSPASPARTSRLPWLLACRQPAHREAHAQGCQHRCQRLLLDGVFETAHRFRALVLDCDRDVAGAAANLVEQRFCLFHQLGLGGAGCFLGRLGCVHGRVSRRAGARLRQRREVAPQGGHVLP